MIPSFLWARLGPVKKKHKRTIEAPYVPGRRLVTITTDGSCHRNPGPGGWAAILQEDGTEKERVISGYDPVTTNNRMELMAILRGLQRLGESSNVLVVTDSAYSISACESCSKSRGQGWKRGKNTIVKNSDILEDIYHQLCRHRVLF